MPLEAPFFNAAFSAFRRSSSAFRSSAGMFTLLVVVCRGLTLKIPRSLFRGMTPRGSDLALVSYTKRQASYGRKAPRTFTPVPLHAPTRRLHPATDARVVLERPG